MTTTAVIYFVLQWITFYILYVYGRKIDMSGSLYESDINQSKNYWRLAVIPILAYSLFLGLRWGHDIDYNIYAERYDSIDNIFAEEGRSSPFFTSIVLILKSIGVPYPIFIILQSGFLMFSALFFLRDYRGYLRWILPMLLIAFASNDNLIRYFLAQSFMFIGLYYFYHENMKKFVLYSIGASLTHFGLIPFALFVLCSKYFDKKFLPKYLVLIIYVVALFTVSISQMQYLVIASTYISSLFGDSDFTMVGYLNAMDEIINGTGEGGTLIFASSLTNKLKSLLTFIPLIYWGQSVLRDVKYGKYIYNMAVINLIFDTVLGQAEVLSRFIFSFNIYVVIALAMIIKNWRLQGRGLPLLYSYLLIVFYCYALITAPFVREDYQMYFLWDSHGAVTNWAPYNLIYR